MPGISLVGRFNRTERTEAWQGRKGRVTGAVVASPTTETTVAMFERFTERARQVVVLAQEEARTLKHSHIGTEHILLGLIREEEGLAARVLQRVGFSETRTRNEILAIAPRGTEDVPPGQIPFTPRAKKALELSLREALSLGHNYIGTEHVLLGLLRDDEGVAARILSVDADVLRARVVQEVAPRRFEPVQEAEDDVAAQLVGHLHDYWLARPASRERGYTLALLNAIKRAA